MDVCPRSQKVKNGLENGAVKIPPEETETGPQKAAKGECGETRDEPKFVPDLNTGSQTKVTIALTRVHRQSKGGKPDRKVYRKKKHAKAFLECEDESGRVKLDKRRSKQKLRV